MSDVETFDVECPYCHKPVTVQWDNGPRGGLLPGPYSLVGDLIFHDECWDAYVAEHPWT